MAKRDLSSLVNGIIGNASAIDSETVPTPQIPKEQKRNAGRPKNENSKEEVRATFVVEKELLRKIKFIAVADDCMLKDIINKAIRQFTTQWEFERGEINLP